MLRSSPRQRYALIETPAERDAGDFAAAVAAGLSLPEKTLPCRFLYDARGSRLFEAICETPEYYLTRAEHEILEARAGAIAARFDEPITLAELGSGSARKTRLLIEAFLARHAALRYVPVDISRGALRSQRARPARALSGSRGLRDRERVSRGTPPAARGDGGPEAGRLARLERRQLRPRRGGGLPAPRPARARRRGSPAARGRSAQAARRARGGLRRRARRHGALHPQPAGAHQPRAGRALRARGLRPPRALAARTRARSRSIW